MKQERKDKKNEKIQELTEKLQTGIQELYDSEKYRDYLVQWQSSIITASITPC